MQALRELLAVLDIQVNGLRQLQSADQTIRGVAGALRAFAGAGAVGLVAGGLVKLTKGMVESATRLRNQADELNVTTDELQKYEFASEAAGVSTHDFALAMRYLERNAGAAALGVKGNQKALARMGIQAVDAAGKVRPLWDILGDLADKMQKNPDKAVGMAMMALGRGGAALVPLLKQGRVGLIELQKAFSLTGGGINKDFIENSKKAQIQLALFKYGLLTVKSALAGEVLPYLMRGVEAFLAFARGTEWAREHTYGLATALMFLGGAALLFGLYKLVSVVEYLGEALGITWSVGLFELLPIILAVGLLYLAFDDIYTLVNGGDSVIGRWLDGTYGPGSAKKFVEDVNAAIAALKQAMDPIAELAKTAGSELLQAFSDALPGLIRGVAIAIMGVGAAIDTVVTGVKQFLALKDAVNDDGSIDPQKWKAAQDIGGSWLERIKKYGNVISGLWGDNGPAGAGGGASAPNTASAPAPAPQLPPPPAPTQVAVEQHFHGPADPKAVKDASRSGVRQGLQDAHAPTYDNTFAAVSR